MTRTHAAYQLLCHGPLDMGEFQAITGWTYRSCVMALWRLRGAGRIRLVNRSGGHGDLSIYEVTA